MQARFGRREGPRTEYALYKATPDWSSYVVSILACIACLVFILYQFNRYISEMWLIPATIASVTVLLVFVSYGLSPVLYEIDEEYLRIHAPLYQIKVELENIERVHQINAGENGWAIRIIGMGGIFSYVGLYFNLRHGWMTFYCNKLRNRVMVITKDQRKLILSPNYPEDFTEHLDSIVNPFTGSQIIQFNEEEEEEESGY